MDRTIKPKGKFGRDPLTEAQIRLIIDYRKDGLTYNEIGKRMGISDTSARKYCVELIPGELENNKQGRPKKAPHIVIHEDVTNDIRIKKKSPKPYYKAVRDYDFLQYIRVVFKWATENHPKLSRRDIEMLLYLYPRGAFTYAMFHKYHKTMGIYEYKTLERLIEDGYIGIWKQRKGKEPALYSMTENGKDLCNKMHKYCTGEFVIPEGRTNMLQKNKEVRINSYYMDMIKDMNKRKRGT